MAIDFALKTNLTLVLTLDAFFAVKSVFQMAQSVYSIPLQTPLVEVIVNAKKLRRLLPGRLGRLPRRELVVADLVESEKYNRYSSEDKMTEKTRFRFKDSDKTDRCSAVGESWRIGPRKHYSILNVSLLHVPYNNRNF